MSEIDDQKWLIWYKVKAMVLFAGHSRIQWCGCDFGGNYGTIELYYYSRSLIGRTPFYAGIDKVKFKNRFVRGVVEVKARIINQRGLVFFVEGVATVDNEICAKAEMIFALVDNDKIEK